MIESIGSNCPKISNVKTSDEPYGDISNLTCRLKSVSLSRETLQFSSSGKSQINVSLATSVPGRGCATAKGNIIYDESVLGSKMTGYREYRCRGHNSGNAQIMLGVLKSRLSAESQNDAGHAVEDISSLLPALEQLTDELLTLDALESLTNEQRDVVNKREEVVWGLLHAFTLLLDFLPNKQARIRKENREALSEELVNSALDRLLNQQKPGEDRQSYEAKIRALIQSSPHLMSIELRERLASFFSAGLATLYEPVKQELDRTNHTLKYARNFLSEAAVNAMPPGSNPFPVATSDFRHNVKKCAEFLDAAVTRIKRNSHGMPTSQNETAKHKREEWWRTLEAIRWSAPAKKIIMSAESTFDEVSHYLDPLKLFDKSTRSLPRSQLISFDKAPANTRGLCLRLKELSAPVQAMTTQLQHAAGQLEHAIARAKSQGIQALPRVDTPEKAVLAELQILTDDNPQTQLLQAIHAVGNVARQVLNAPALPPLPQSPQFTGLEKVFHLSILEFFSTLQSAASQLIQTLQLAKNDLQQQSVTDGLDRVNRMAEKMHNDLRYQLESSTGVSLDSSREWLNEHKNILLRTLHPVTRITGKGHTQYPALTHRTEHVKINKARFCEIHRSILPMLNQVEKVHVAIRMLEMALSASGKENSSKYQALNTAIQKCRALDLNDMRKTGASAVQVSASKDIAVYQRGDISANRTTTLGKVLKRLSEELLETAQRLQIAAGIAAWSADKNKHRLKLDVTRMTRQLEAVKAEIKDVVWAATGTRVHNNPSEGMIAKDAGEWLAVLRKEWDGKYIKQEINDETEKFIRCISKEFAGEDDPEGHVFNTRIMLALKDAEGDGIPWPLTAAAHLGGTKTHKAYIQAWAEKRLTYGMLYNLLVHGTTAAMFSVRKSSLVSPLRLLNLLLTPVRMEMTRRAMEKVRPGNPRPSALIAEYESREKFQAAVRLISMLSPQLFKTLAAIGITATGLMEGGEYRDEFLKRAVSRLPGDLFWVGGFVAWGAAVQACRKNNVDGTVSDFQITAEMLATLKKQLEEVQATGGNQYGDEKDSAELKKGYSTAELKSLKVAYIANETGKKPRQTPTQLHVKPSKIAEKPISLAPRGQVSVVNDNTVRVNGAANERDNGPVSRLSKLHQQKDVKRFCDIEDHNVAQPLQKTEIYKHSFSERDQEGKNVVRRVKRWTTFPPLLQGEDEMTIYLSPARNYSMYALIWALENNGENTVWVNTPDGNTHKQFITAQWGAVDVEYNEEEKCHETSDNRVINAYISNLARIMIGNNEGLESQLEKIIHENSNLSYKNYITILNSNFCAGKLENILLKSQKQRENDLHEEQLREEARVKALEESNARAKKMHYDHNVVMYLDGKEDNGDSVKPIPLGSYKISIPKTTVEVSLVSVINGDIPKDLIAKIVRPDIIGEDDWQDITSGKLYNEIKEETDRLDEEISGLAKFITTTEEVIKSVQSPEDYIREWIKNNSNLDPDDTYTFYIRHPLQDRWKGNEKIYQNQIDTFRMNHPDITRTVTIYDIVTGKVLYDLNPRRSTNIQIDMPLNHEVAVLSEIREQAFVECKKYYEEINKVYSTDLDRYFTLSAKLYGGEALSTSVWIGKLKEHLDEITYTETETETNFGLSVTKEVIGAISTFIPLSPLNSFVLITGTQVGINLLQMQNASSPEEKEMYRKAAGNAAIYGTALTIPGIISGRPMSRAGFFLRKVYGHTAANKVQTVDMPVIKTSSGMQPASVTSGNTSQYFWFGKENRYLPIEVLSEILSAELMEDAGNVNPTHHPLIVNKGQNQYADVLSVSKSEGSHIEVAALIENDLQLEPEQKNITGTNTVFSPQLTDTQVRQIISPPPGAIELSHIYQVGPYAMKTGVTLYIESDAYDYIVQHGFETHSAPVIAVGKGVYIDSKFNMFFCIGNKRYEVVNYDGQAKYLEIRAHSGGPIKLYLDDDLYLRQRLSTNQEFNAYIEVVGCRMKRAPGNPSGCRPIFMTKQLDEHLCFSALTNKISKKTIITHDLEFFDDNDYPNLYFNNKTGKLYFLHEGNYFNAEFINPHSERNPTGRTMLRVFSHGGIFRKKQDIALIVAEKERGRITLKTNIDFLAETLNVDSDVASHYLYNTELKHINNARDINGAVAQTLAAKQYFIPEMKPVAEVHTGSGDDVNFIIKMLYPERVVADARIEVNVINLALVDDTSPFYLRATASKIRNHVAFIKNEYIPTVLKSLKYPDENTLQYLRTVFNTQDADFIRKAAFALSQRLKAISSNIDPFKIFISYIKKKPMVTLGVQFGDEHYYSELTEQERSRGTLAFVFPDNSGRLVINQDKVDFIDSSHPNENENVSSAPLELTSLLMHEASHINGITSDITYFPIENGQYIPVQDAINDMAEKIKNGFIVDNDSFDEINKDYFNNVSVYRGIRQKIASTDGLGYILLRDPGYLTHLMLNNADGISILTRDIYTISRTGTLNTTSAESM